MRQVSASGVSHRSPPAQTNRSGMSRLGSPLAAESKVGGENERPGSGKEAWRQCALYALYANESLPTVDRGIRIGATCTCSPGSGRI